MKRAGMQVMSGELQALSAEWANQGWDVRSAQRALSRVELSGVPPSVAGDLAGFSGAWADALGDLAHDVQRMADAVAATGQDLEHVDQMVGNEWR